MAPLESFRTGNTLADSYLACSLMAYLVLKLQTLLTKYLAWETVAWTFFVATFLMVLEHPSQEDMAPRDDCGKGILPDHRGDSGG